MQFSPKHRSNQSPERLEGENLSRPTVAATEKVCQGQDNGSASDQRRFGSKENSSRTTESTKICSTGFPQKQFGVLDDK